MSQMSPWMRNIQFGTLGVFYTCLFALKDVSEIQEKGFLYGFYIQVFYLYLLLRGLNNSNSFRSGQ